MNNFNEFIDYCLDFYGVSGIYPENKRTKEQIAYATTMYLDACAYYEQQPKPWGDDYKVFKCCLLYTSPSPRDQRGSRMPASG